MKPYYQDEWVTIYHGDCREILPSLDKVDLVLTDPPYGVNYKSGRSNNFEAIGGDSNTDIALIGLALSLKVLRNNRHLYMFGRYDLSRLPISAPVELIWDKGIIGMGDLTSAWGSSHEYIQFATNVPSKKNRANGYGRLSARLRKGSVLRCDRKNSRGNSLHPTEKPVLILRQMIESSSIIGDTVLDPFIGSGSTLEASILEARHCIGIEIEEKYCEIAAKRCSQSVMNFNPTQ